MAASSAPVSGGQAGGGGVLAGLAGAAGTGDHRGDAGLLDDPAQGRLRGVGTPAGMIVANARAASTPVSKSTPEKVSPTSNASPWRL